MAYTDFIAAIDLGTSHMVGMVGTKNATGALSIIAYEVENSGTCIRRGCVYNIDETAMRIKRLVNKLENKLNGTKIGKVYVGLAGQSLCSIEHSVSKLLGVSGVVTDELLDSLRQECCKYQSDDMRDVLVAVSPVYFLDNKQVANPVGLSCSRIEARYRLIVGRPSLKRNLIYSVERAKLEIAGLIVSSLALADSVLTDTDKAKGCALIEFGAGVTTLVVYKEGKLLGWSVVPFGGNVITKDIESLGLSTQEAERLKQTYGSAVTDRTNDHVQITSSIGFGAAVTQKELNNVVEARTKEIVENVFACLERMVQTAGMLGAGVVIAGGGANLQRLPDLIKEIFKLEVRYASVSRNSVESGDLVTNDSLFAVALSILMKGEVNCAVTPEPVFVPEQPDQVEEKSETSVVTPEPEVKEPQAKTSIGKDTRKGGTKSREDSFWDKLRRKRENLMGGLFDEENI